MKRESGIFYRSFWQAIKTLPESEQSAAYNSLFELMFDGNEVECSGIAQGLMMVIKPQIRANIVKWENGSKAKGGTKKKRNRSKVEAKKKLTGSETDANIKQDGSETEAYVNVNDNVNDNELKLQFGFVFPEGLSENRKELLMTWLTYKNSRKEKYKTQQSFETLIKKYNGYTDQDFSEMIENSIANNYAGLFGDTKKNKYGMKNNHDPNSQLPPETQLKLKNNAALKEQDEGLYGVAYRSKVSHKQDITMKNVDANVSLDQYLTDLGYDEAYKNRIVAMANKIIL